MPQELQPNIVVSVREDGKLVIIVFHPQPIMGQLDARPLDEQLEDYVTRPN
jgi:hypothetical protein